MTILMDGQYTTQQVKNKVTYTPPTKPQYNASTLLNQQKAYQEEMRRRQQEAQRQQQNAYAQRMQAQADAYKKQQQAMQQQQQQKFQPPQQIPPINQNLTQGYKPNQLQQGVTMNMQAQPDRWATTPQSMQMIQNYRSTPQPDRWANNPNTNQYIKNYLDYKKKQDDELKLLRQMSWQNGPAANFFFQGLGPPVPPGFYDKPTQITGGGGGDWGDWGDYPYYNGGGGGGGGYEYTPPPPEWWVEMVQWRI